MLQIVLRHRLPFKSVAKIFIRIYDLRPEFVGGTIHKLSKGIDSGDILYHALPSLTKINSPFEFTMNAVRAVQESIIKYIQSGKIFKLDSVKQEGNLLIRYSLTVIVH